MCSVDVVNLELAIDCMSSVSYSDDSISELIMLEVSVPPATTEADSPAGPEIPGPGRRGGIRLRLWTWLTDVMDDSVSS